MARCWSQRPAAHSSRRCRRSGCSSAGWLSDKSTQGRVQQPQRSGLVLRTSAKARARPRVVVAAYEYLEQNTAVGAVGEVEQKGQLVAWRRSARSIKTMTPASRAPEGPRACSCSCADVGTRWVFKAVKPPEREDRALDARHGDVLRDDVAGLELRGW